jgi:hypothetical protein
MNALSSTSSGQHVNELYLEPSERPVEFVPQRSRPEGMIVGRIVGFNEQGLPLLTWPGFRDDTPHPSQTITPLSVQDIGRDVVLAFVTVDLVQQPMIMGLIQKPTPLPATKTAPAQGLEVITDGKRMILTAQEEITLRCGKASITMTKAGKVLIEGDYLLSRSRGSNRIKGGSVQIN